MAIPRIEQRAVSVATIKERPGGFSQPVISHIYGDEWFLTPQSGQIEALAYVHAIWPRIQLRWIKEPGEWAKAMRETGPGERRAA